MTKLKINTTNLNILTSRLKDSALSWGTNIHTVVNRELPKKIGDFTYLSEIEVEKGVKFYKYALYKNSQGILGFSKTWFGDRKDSRYHWLKDEISLLTIYTRSFMRSATYRPDTKFRLPEVYEVYESDGCLMYICEYVPEAEEDLSDDELSYLYSEAIEYIRGFGAECRNELNFNILTIGPLKLLVSLPLVTLKALISKPQLWREILTGFVFYIKHGLQLFQIDWNTLVHRDIRGTILRSGMYYYIIDWQTAAISNPMLDVAQLFLSYWQESKLAFDVFKLKVAEEIFFSKKNLTCFKLICLYMVFVEIGFIGLKSTSEEKSFIEQLLNLEEISH